MRKAIKPLMLISAVSLFAAGCGGDSASSDTIPADADVTVHATGSITFDAKEYSATAGMVKFAYVNDSAIRHTLLVVKDGEKYGDFKLVIAKKGEVDSDSVSLDAGTYTLICDVPGHSNMKAELTVK